MGIAVETMQISKAVITAGARRAYSTAFLGGKGCQRPLQDHLSVQGLHTRLLRQQRCPWKYTQTRQATIGRGSLSFRGMMRNHPIMFPVAIAGVIFGAAGFVWAASVYWKMYRLMGNYPERVGLKLRRAIYFTDVNEDPAQAMKAYVQALQFAAQEGMDPLSDEVIGIKMELARFLEKSGNAKNGVEVCESLKKDILASIEENATVAENAGQRRRLLSWACKIGTKLADLYADPYVADAEKSEANLVWAVETNIRERQRREKEGVKEGEGDWLDNDELGSQLEALGHMYEERDKHYFAAQLFLQALMVKPKKDCHAVILMNNLAAALAQQVPPAEPGLPPPSPAELRESGRTWAKQALTLAATIVPPERNAECDRGCVAATHNLGEFAEMDGNIAEARTRYEEAASIAHAIGFEEGMVSADEGLRRLEGGGQKTKKRWW